MTAPYWRRANYPGRCHACRQRFRAGARILWDARRKVAFCQRETCGQRVMRAHEHLELERAEQDQRLLDAQLHERALSYPDPDE